MKYAAVSGYIVSTIALISGDISYLILIMYEIFGLSMFCSFRDMCCESRQKQKRIKNKLDGLMRSAFVFFQSTFFLQKPCWLHSLSLLGSNIQ